MNKILLSFVFATFAASSAFGLEIRISTGKIKVPNPDGSFSNVLIGQEATLFLSLTDESTYNTYVNDSARLYQAWQSGMLLADDEYSYSGYTDENSQYIISVFSWDESLNWYAIAIATYISADSGREYYIARVLKREYSGNDPDFDVLSFSEAISDAGRWQVIYGEPPTITCTAFAVTNNVVTATYAIDEFSRLNEVVGGNAANVVVLSNLSQPDNTTNLAATVTGTDSAASTFTLSFNPSEQNWASPTLFIKGVEPPAE